MDMNGKIVRIGGASGFWGDSAVAAPQLVGSGAIDYLVFDYLAETTMAILAAARAKRPEFGYATDFVDIAMRSVLGEVVRRDIKVVSNAGGINPQGCAEALRRLAEAQGLTLRIAVVDGDNVSTKTGAFIPGGMNPGAKKPGAMNPGANAGLADAAPERLLSANAYLGALPIARALDAGADVVITGRCVDSATTLGVLIHEFGWRDDDWDRLAAGSLAGHIIECGCQATGGLHTDWEAVPDWATIGYPVVECHADGGFTLTKPAGTGGLVVRAAVAEQLLYEIGDPGAYLLPDVICDFREVRIEQAGADRVAVSGAKGRAPTDAYKVSATTMDGYRCAGTLVIIGIDAVRKAERSAEAILARTRAMLAAAGMADFRATRIEAVGAESIYGPHARSRATREVTMRVVAEHPLKAALELFAREIAPAGTSWSPGTTGASGGRPAVTPVIKSASFMIDKDEVEAAFVLEGERHVVAIGRHAGSATAPEPAPPPAPVIAAAGSDMVVVPLLRLAWARSGDKGDLSNIGLVARRPEILPWLWAQVTPAVVKAYFAHLVDGEVERFHLPGIQAINYLLHDALDGGGTASRRIDPLGKGMGQMLLDLEIAVPREVAGRP